LISRAAAEYAESELTKSPGACLASWLAHPLVEVVAGLTAARVTNKRVASSSGQYAFRVASVPPEL
jgi:hypothetical protein